MTGRVSGAQIQTFTDALAEGLRPTFQAISDLVQPAAAFARRPDVTGRADSALNVLDAACQAGLTREPELLHGIGYMASPGVIAESAYWARWWSRESFGGLKLGEHVLDPAQEEFYDYPRSEWFDDLRQGSDEVVFGPYVDFNGTNDYTITLARAVRDNGSFLGSVGGDIMVSALERKFEPILREIGVPALLVNEEDRVVISTHAEWTVGSRLTGSSQRSHETHRLEPWTLMVFGT